MMQDNQTIKAKAAAMSAIMRDPKLSRVISDVWSAPPGSTMNEKAKNVLKSLQTTNTNFAYVQDGKGGNGTFDQNFIGPMQEGMARTPSPGIQTPEIKNEPTMPENPIPTRYGIAESVDSFLPKDSPYLGSGATYEPKGTAQPWYEKQLPVTSLTIKTGKEGGITPIERWTRQQTPEWKNLINEKYKGIDPNTTAGDLISSGFTTKPEDITGRLLLQDSGMLPEAGDWVPRALGWIDTEGKFQSYNGLDLIASDPGGVDAFQNWLTSKASDGKTLADFWGDESFNSMANLLQEFTPIKKQEIENKLTDPNAEWEQKDVDMYYLKLLQDKLTPNPELWGHEGLPTDEEIREKVFGDTGLNPTGQGSVLPEEGDKTAETLNLTADILGDAAFDLWYDDKDPSLKDYYKSAYENVISGKGRSGFYRDAFSDTDFMESLGVPKSVIDTWPKSGLLAEHLIDLKEIVKEDYGLVEMEEKIKEMQNQGLTVADDMKAYIRGKDTNLVNIEKLIDEAETKTAEMDTSNPYVAERMSNYMNYLNILHGRTNQRYIDYLDSNYKLYEVRQQRLENRYNSAFSKAEEEYKNLSVISTEAYNNIKGQLDRIYNMVEIQNGSYETMSDEAAERLQAAENLKRVTLDNQLKELQIKNYGLKDIEKPEWSDVQSLLGAEKTKDGIVSLITKDPLTAYMKAMEAGGIATGYDPDTVVSHQLDWLQQFLEQEIKGGRLDDSVKGIHTDLLESYDEALEQIEASNASLEKKTEESDYIYNTSKNKIEEIYQSGLKRIESVAKRSLRDDLEAKPTFATDVREAIKDLVGVGLFDIKEKDAGSFISEWEDKIGSTVARTLFDTYQMERATGKKGKETFSIGGTPLWEIPNDKKVSNEVAKLVFNNILTL